MSRFAAECVLPLRWHADHDLDDLTRYLAELSLLVDVTVVDSSPPALFDRHHAAWGQTVRHLPPAPWPGRNGKVRNVMTGVRAARHERIIIADDDVRYETKALAEGLDLLEDADLIVPQNVFTAWPWHARWDTARQLINRALGGDYPGTVLIRRDMLADRGYHGDVLFENLQLMRTVTARSGVIGRARGLYVGRRPPTTRHFLSQRIRQAYDDFAQPARLAVEAALLPAVVLACRAAGNGRALAMIALPAIATAEAGRRRAGGKAVFPPTSPMWAPCWLAERAICVWLAIGYRLTGGIRYGDGRIWDATTSPHSAAIADEPLDDTKKEK